MKYRNEKLTVTFHNLYTGALTKDDYFDKEQQEKWNVFMISNIDGTWELTLTVADITVKPDYVLLDDGRWIASWGTIDYRSIEIH